MGRICEKCHKTYSSRQSLCNHSKYCKSGAAKFTVHSNSSRTRSQDELKSVQNHHQNMTKPTNPKISALVDAIINEDVDNDKPSTPVPPMMPERISKKVKDLPDIEFDTDEESSESDSDEPMDSVTSNPEQLDLSSR